MRFHVRLTGAVAAFTAGVFGFFLFAGDAFEMRVFVKAEPDVRMAGLANGIPTKAPEGVWENTGAATNASSNTNFVALHTPVAYGVASASVVRTL